MSNSKVCYALALVVFVLALFSLPVGFNLGLLGLALLALGLLLA